VELGAPTAQPATSETANVPSSPKPTGGQTLLFVPLVVFSPTQTATPTPAPPPTATLPPVEGASCIPDNPREQGTVTRVIDGDTIEVQIGGQKYRVRYIGMDTPEDTSQVEYFGPEATRYNQDLVGGKNVVMIKDVSETDQYGRLLRYVIAGGVFVNYQMARQGYASAATFPPDVACSAAFVAAERQARAAGLGLWKPAPPEAPTAPPPSSDNCDASYPDFCIPPPPPDQDCKDIPQKNFKVLSPDPHRLDGDHDGIGCEK
jgi:micrococcal nuclease